MTLPLSRFQAGGRVGDVRRLKRQLGDETETRVIVGISAARHRIYGVAAEGMTFIRDAILEGTPDQIKEALDHERRELETDDHNDIRGAQYNGNLRELIRQISDRDKSPHGQGRVEVRPSQHFKNGYEPVGIVVDNIASRTSSLTAVVLTKLGLRGKARGLRKSVPAEKILIGQIKDEADGAAKKIYEAIVKAAGIVLRVRVSEGFGRDDVAESFKANDVVNPSGENGEEDAIIDVVENTNAFVFDVDGKKVSELEDREAGGTSVIVTGTGVAALGNCPDVYADGIFTSVLPEHQKLVNDLLDSEITAEEPNLTVEQRQKYIAAGFGSILGRDQRARIEWLLELLAVSNNITINDLEVVLMDRLREATRIAALEAISESYPGLQITTIKDGTVAHSLMATFGRREGKHKVVMTVAGAPEAFLNLSVVSIFKEAGAVASLRVVSKSVNRNADGTATRNLGRRYEFSESEKSGPMGIANLRPDDCQDIFQGERLFTVDDVQGDVVGSFSFITNNGVFGVPGARKTEEGNYQVKILRVAKISDRPCAWFEDKIFTKDEMDRIAGEVSPGVVAAPIMKAKKNNEEVSVWEAALNNSGALEQDTAEIMNSELYETEVAAKLVLLQEQLTRVGERYGDGVFGRISRIRIVDNLTIPESDFENDFVPCSMVQGSGSDAVLLLDKDALDHADKLFLVLAHELREGILQVVAGDDHVLRELTSIYLSVKEALAMGITDVGDVGDLPEEYQFMQVVAFLRARYMRQELTDEMIMAAVIAFMLRVSYYRDIILTSPSFGVDFFTAWSRQSLQNKRKIIARYGIAINSLELRYQAALETFNQVIEAEKLIRAVKIREAKMTKDQVERASARQVLGDVSRCFSDFLLYLKDDVCDLVFLDAKMGCGATRDSAGKVAKQYDDKKYRVLWEFLRSKGISSVAIDRIVLPEVKETLEELIIAIDDVLIRASEVDFIGYAEVNGLTIKLTDDVGGKRIVITRGTGAQTASLIDQLNSAEKTNQIAEVRDDLEDSDVIGYRIDVDAMTDALAEEIRSKQGNHNQQFFYYSSSGQDGAQIAAFLREKRLSAAVEMKKVDKFIALVTPQQMNAVRARARIDLASDYYLVLPYTKGVTILAQDVVQAEGNYTALHPETQDILGRFWKRIRSDSGEGAVSGLIDDLIAGRWDGILPDVECLADDLATVQMAIKMLEMSA